MHPPLSPASSPVSAFGRDLARRSDVCFGSWPCENARTLDGDRRSYSSKSILAINRASAFNENDELENVFLAASRSFAFLHGQGQTEKNSVRAYVFRSTLKLGHRSIQPAFLKRANTRLMHRSKGTGAIRDRNLVPRPACGKSRRGELTRCFCGDERRDRTLLRPYGPARVVVTLLGRPYRLPARPASR
jgi:hypothetical protein